MSTKKPVVSKETLSDSFTVNLENGTQDVFMSYGMLTRISAFVPSVDEAMDIISRTSTSRAIIQVLLAPKDEKGVPQVEKMDIDSLLISKAEAIRLVSWAAEHVLSFLLDSMQAQMSLLEKKAPEMSRVIQISQEKRLSMETTLQPTSTGTTD
jgi:hypothetical protein